MTPGELAGPRITISDGGAEALAKLGRVALSQSVLAHGPIGMAHTSAEVERQQGTIEARESFYGGAAFVINLPIESEVRDE